MKKNAFLVFTFGFLMSSFAFGDFEDPTDYSSQLKADSGPQCSHFTVGKDLTIFCLKDPTTQVLYQFEYSINGNPREKILKLSTYDPRISQFVPKMTATLAVVGKVRQATLDDPKLSWHATLPLLDSDKNAPDESYFHAMVTDDLYPTRQTKDPTLGPKSSAPEAKFMMGVFNHLAMTPVAQQKLLETNNLPKLQ
jgi:hypothetical protein